MPVSMTFADLHGKIKWAMLADSEARRVQQQGSTFARRFLTPEQGECWMFLMLLELARLEAGISPSKPEKS